MKSIASALLCVLLLSASAGAATPAAGAASEARALFEAKDPRAVAAIEALARSRPDDAEAQVLLVRLRLRQGHAEDAVDVAEEVVDLAPDDAQAQYWLGNAYGTRIGQVGMLSKATMAPRLRNAFETAVKLDPQLHDARNSLVEFYLQAPAIAGGSVDKARAQAAELARRDPPRGHYARGRIAQHAGDSAAAADAFLAAHRARPGDAGMRMAAAVALQEARRWDAAFALLKDWVREDPKASGAWYQIGRTSALSGQRTDLGATALQRFLALPPAAGQPEKHHAWFRLGQVKAHAGDTAGARAAFQQVLAADPDHDEARAALSKL